MTSSIPCTGTTVLKWRGVPPWRGQAWYRCTRPRLREPQCHARDCLGAGPGGRASSASPTAGALGPRTGWAACSTAGSGCAPPRTTGVHPSRNRAHRPARARGSATFNPAGATLFDEQIAQISSATAIDTLITKGGDSDGSALVRPAGRSRHNARPITRAVGLPRFAGGDSGNALACACGMLSRTIEVPRHARVALEAHGSLKPKSDHRLRPIFLAARARFPRFAPELQAPP